MISRIMKIHGTILFILLSLSSLAYSFDEKAITTQWNSVKGSSEESYFLMELFIRQRMPGEYPQVVKQRFRDISTLDDAIYLLDKLIDPNQKDQHAFVVTLLKELDGDDYVLLFEDYFYLASTHDVRNILFNIITKQNSVAAFMSATRIIEHLQTDGINLEEIGFLNYFVRFTHPEIRQEVLTSVLSPSPLIRAASYVALRNYPDKEVELIIDNAFATETSLITSNERDLVSKKKAVLHSDVDSLPIIDILNTTKDEIERNKKRHDSMPMQWKERADPYTTQVQSVSSSSSDITLAQAYAPDLLLSSFGAIGVNIRDSSYLYTDYIPISVSDVTSNQYRLININLANSVIYNGHEHGPGDVPLSDGAININILGDAAFRSSSNYLDFSPIWESLAISTGYKTLSLTPTVYFKVFRDSTKHLPIAIQYWFFYFYNDWLLDHPGDWESITVFLDASAQPAEVAFSTHYEATRYSQTSTSPPPKNIPTR